MCINIHNTYYAVTLHRDHTVISSPGTMLTITRFNHCIIIRNGSGLPFVPLFFGHHFFYYKIHSSHTLKPKSPLPCAQTAPSTQEPSAHITRHTQSNTHYTPRNKWQCAPKPPHVLHPEKNTECTQNCVHRGHPDLSTLWTHNSPYKGHPFPETCDHHLLRQTRMHQCHPKQYTNPSSIEKKRKREETER